jgi:hypothetical protein
MPQGSKLANSMCGLAKALESSHYSKACSLPVCLGRSSTKENIDHLIKDCTWVKQIWFHSLLCVCFEGLK